METPICLLKKTNLLTEKVLEQGTNVIQLKINLQPDTGRAKRGSRVKQGTRIPASACGVIKLASGGAVKSKGKICPEGKAWAKRTFDKYPSAYANLAASKYCKDPNYAKKSKRKKK